MPCAGVSPNCGMNAKRRPLTTVARCCCRLRWRTSPRHSAIPGYHGSDSLPRPCGPWHTAQRASKISRPQLSRSAPDGCAHSSEMPSGGFWLPGRLCSQVMTSSIIWSVIGPPYSTPHAGMSVPGRPRSVLDRIRATRRGERELAAPGRVLVGLLALEHRGAVAVGAAHAQRDLALDGAKRLRVGFLGERRRDREDQAPALERLLVEALLEVALALELAEPVGGDEDRQRHRREKPPPEDALEAWTLEGLVGLTGTQRLRDPEQHGRLARPPRAVQVDGPQQNGRHEHDRDDDEDVLVHRPTGLGAPLGRHAVVA